jgi:putative exosortase-associated protein (TIGR04073 family)
MALFASAGPALADVGPDAEGAFSKLGRGASNLVLGFIEIPKNISSTAKTEGALSGATVGLGKGIGHTLKRMAVGVFEIVTFPFPVPNDSYGPIVEPDYPWEDSVL